MAPATIAGVTTREWDAATYDRVADPQVRWGAKVLAGMDLRGNERVLDAGCGSGRVTQLLLGLVPNGEVVALDASTATLRQARERLQGDGRVEFVLADLAQPLPLERAVDAVFSNATFHWIADHDALFRNLATAMSAGGQLVAQCGGLGNIASIVSALRDMGEQPGPVHFASAEATARRLEAAGFVEVRTWLHPEPTEFESGEPFETFLATVVLRTHLPSLQESERRAFVHEVARRLPGPRIDYVRLNIMARRAGRSRVEQPTRADFEQP